MDNTKERINSIHDNPEVMRRYEQQKHELEEIKEALQDMIDSKQQKRDKLKEIRRPWETSLVNLVDKASILFSGYMKELGCAGKLL